MHNIHCNVCKLLKPASGFTPSEIRSKSGLTGRCTSCKSTYKKKWQLLNSELEAAKKRFRYYKITEEQYQSMLAEQNNKCAFCLKPATKTLHVDHDHDTLAVRQLLCQQCNSALGLLYENVETMQRMIASVKKHTEISTNEHST